MSLDKIEYDCIVLWKAKKEMEELLKLKTKLGRAEQKITLLGAGEAGQRAAISPSGV
jgi:hypothetical protein